MELSSAISASSSSSTSSSSFRFNRRRSFIQVATCNSSTFIQLPTNIRQSSPFVPTYRSRPPSFTTENGSISSHSKFSFRTANKNHKRSYCQQRFNPILNNPLLNHRTESPKSVLSKNSTDFSHTTKLCLLSQPLKTSQDDDQTENFIESFDVITNNIEDDVEEQVDQRKHDYIKRWLCEIREATYHTPELSSKSKRSKKGHV